MEFTKKVGKIQKMLEEISASLKVDGITQEKIADNIKVLLRYVEEEYFLCPSCFREAETLNDNYCGMVVLGCTNCASVWTRYRK